MGHCVEEIIIIQWFHSRTVVSQCEVFQSIGVICEISHAEINICYYFDISLDQRIGGMQPRVVLSVEV